MRAYLSPPNRCAALRVLISAFTILIQLLTETPRVDLVGLRKEFQQIEHTMVTRPGLPIDLIDSTRHHKTYRI